MGDFLFHFILPKTVVRYPRNIVCVSQVHFLNNLDSSDPLPGFQVVVFSPSIVFMGGSLGWPLQIGRRNSLKVIDIYMIGNIQRLHKEAPRLQFRFRDHTTMSG